VTVADGPGGGGWLAVCTGDWRVPRRWLPRCCWRRVVARRQPTVVSGRGTPGRLPGPRSAPRTRVIPRQRPGTGTGGGGVAHPTSAPPSPEASTAGSSRSPARAPRSACPPARSRRPKTTTPATPTCGTAQAGPTRTTRPRPPAWPVCPAHRPVSAWEWIPAGRPTSPPGGRLPGGRRQRRRPKLGRHHLVGAHRPRSRRDSIAAGGIALLDIMYIIGAECPGGLGTDCRASVPSRRARPAKAIKAIRLILVSRAIIKGYPT
jgi:hypothetical protein